MSNNFFRFLPPLLLAFFTLSLTAQPTTHFYRAWTTNSSHAAHDFTNHIVSVVNGTDTYVAGSTLGATTTYTLNLSKFNARGVLQWSTTFYVNSGGDTYAGAIALDPSGNILVTGSTYNGSTNGYDLYIAKFNSSGTKLWHQLYNGSGNSYDGGTAVICNSSGNVFVTGGTSISATNIDVVTICYNSSGTAQWTQTYNNASYYDFAGGIGLHSTSVGITGFTQVNATTWEYLTIDYAQSTGTLGTASHTSIGGTVIDRINATAFDASGNVYITGAMGNGTNGLDIKTVKLDASLNILWTATYDGSAHKDDVGRGIAVDGSGNVYVAGYSSNASDKDAILVKYSSTGSQTWTASYAGTEGDDAFADLAITSDSKIFVGGYCTQKGNRDFYTALYSSGGTKTWSDSQNGIANHDDEIQQVVPDGLGNFIVSGPSVESATTQDVMTTMYGRDELVVPSDELVNAPFIADHGQKLDTDGDPVTGLRYYSDRTYPSVYVFDDKISYLFTHADEDTTTIDTITRVDLSFYVSGGRTSTVDGLDVQEGFYNYYLGHLPEGRQRVPLYNKVLTAGLYPNIDAIYGQGESDMFIHLICKPGSTPSSIKMVFSGATSVSVQGDGSLLVQTILEDLVLPAMTATTITSGGTETAAGWAPTYSIGGDGKVSISLGTYDTDKTLVIKIGRGRNPDGTLCDYWSTYYGSGSDDVALGSDVDFTGHMYFTGNTKSSLFPTTFGAFSQQFTAPIDAYATRFKQPDVLDWGTFYGGNPVNAIVASEVGYAIKWNPGNNNVYFTGLTSSSAKSTSNPNGFPLFTSPNGSGYNNNVTPGGIFSRGFIVRLKDQDGTPNWATFFGDPNCRKDAVTALTIRESGNIAVGGHAYQPATGTPAFPATGSSPMFTQATGDAYIAEFTKDDQLIWATRLASTSSGFSRNTVNDIAEGASGDILVVGTSNADNVNDAVDHIPFGSPTYPTYGFHIGTRDAFIMRFGTNRSLVWSTYFGGDDTDDANSIVALTNGDFVVTGTTHSSAGAYPSGEEFPAMMYGTNTSDKVNDLTLNGESDIFIAKFGSSTNALTWCRYLGGSGDENQGNDEELPGFVLTGPGNATVAVGNSLYLTGRVQNGFTPLKGTGCEHYYGTINGTYDACLTLINDQNVVTFSTYWGGASGGNEDEGITISNGINATKPFVLFGGRTNSGGGTNQTIPVCRESDAAYYNPNLLNNPPTYDGFISKLYLDCQLVATKEQENVQSLALTPNPAVSMINLELEQEGDIPQSIRVFDASGRDCSGLISALSADNKLDVQRLPAGLYFVQIQYKNKLAVGRFVKM